MRLGSKFSPTSSRLQTGVFSKAREDDGRGSWLVDFGTGRRSVKYGTTHTNTNTQKVEYSLKALTVDRMIQHGVPRGLRQDVRQ